MAVQIADRAQSPRWVDTELLPVQRDIPSRCVEAIEHHHRLVAIHHLASEDLLHVVLAVQQPWHGLPDHAVGVDGWVLMDCEDVSVRDDCQALLGH